MPSIYRLFMHSGHAFSPGEDRRLRRSVTALALAVLLPLVLPLPSAAEAEAAGEGSRAAESTLKAAYLSKLPFFVEWPQGDGAVPQPLSFCLLGTDPFGEASTALEEIVRERRHELRRLGPLDDVARCHVLFISASETDRLDAVLARLGTAAVLTVSDAGGFTRAGGMIGFVPHAGRLLIEVNRRAAERAGFRLSAKLLELSRIVEP